MSNSDKSEKFSAKISVGMPVYNGGKFLRKKIESILEQTFSGFELIISDNASTDDTSLICEEYSKKDQRIRYIKQERNMGPTWNFKFVLDQAKCKYFTWTAVDDMMLPEFLEKNVKFLEENKDFVGSVSKSSPYRPDQDAQVDLVDKSFRNLKMNLVSRFRPSMAVSLTGTFGQRVRSLFKRSAYQVIYGIFKTDVLSASMVGKSFVGNDAATVINILKHGNINVIDEVLLYRYDRGMSTRGNLDVARMFNRGIIYTIFPHLPLTFWCARNLGASIFFKNMDHFIKLNLGSCLLTAIDAFRLISLKLKS